MCVEPMCGMTVEAFDLDLLGHFIAGVSGAAAAMCGPTGCLADDVPRVFAGFREARRRIAIEAGLAPVRIELSMPAR